MAELTQDLDRAGSDRPNPSTSAPSGCPVDHRPQVQFSAADRRMRAILRAVSAIRCTITYLLIPLLGSTIGLLDVFSAPLSIALCLFAGFMSIRSMRRFWIANHPKRWAYTAFASVVLVALTVGITVDILRLINR